MAKLPSGTDIARVASPSSTPGISVKAIDYSPLASGASAIGQGLKSVGAAVNLFAKKEEEKQNFEVERKLVDFRLEAEMDLERQRREMPPGGNGFSESWRESFMDRAKAFVGDKYSNIPETLRPNIDLKLTQFEAQLHERAQRDQFAEKDRKSEEDLTLTLGRIRDRAAANPDQLEALRAEGVRLADHPSSGLLPAKRQALARKFSEEAEEAAATAIADGVVDAASHERARQILAPHRGGRITPQTVRTAALGEVSAKYESGGRGVGFVSSGRDDPGGVSYGVHQLSTKDSMPAFVRSPEGAAYAGRFSGLQPGSRAFNAAYRQAAREDPKGFEAAQKSFYTRTHYEPLVEHAKAKGLAVEDRGVQEALFSISVQHGGARKIVDAISASDDPAEQIRALYAARTKYVSGLGSLPENTRRSVLNRYRSEEQDALALAGTKSDSTALVPVGTTDADTYDGPLQNLSIAKRRAIWGRAEAQLDKVKRGVDTMLTSYEEGAVNGRLPSQEELGVVEGRIRALDDPALTAKYKTVLAKAEFSASFTKEPPARAEAIVNRLEEIANTRGTTKQLEAQIEHARKSLTAMQREVKDNPMSWAQRQQIEIPVGVPAGTSFEQAEVSSTTAIPVKLEQLDFRSEDIQAKLRHRFDQAKAVGDYYGQAPQVFAKNERDAFRNTLRRGGDGMLFVIGTIANAAVDRGLDPASIMKEFTKDAPEVAVIAEMVVNNADRGILSTAAKALEWRATQGEKFISTIDRALVKPDLGEYADVLASMPTKVDAVKHTANIVYEYEARRQGKQDFDQTLYRETVRKIMGETMTPDGSVYGGVGRQGTGWVDGKWGSNGWFGSVPKVMVPPDVRQDSFDAMVSTIRAADLAADPPLDQNKVPIPISAIRKASWISVAPGMYGLVLGDDGAGTKRVALNADGSPYALDVRPLLPAIRKRRPDIFRGWDGTGAIDNSVER
jgi:hypothetical protein